MPLRDQLLAPIPGSNPGGVELRYDPVYDRIKEARREDADIPQGEWQTERKTADWPLVVKLATDALSNKSKDLQIAAWLAEAKLRREGFGGLADALDLIDGLLEQFWDHLYPEIEDGDLEIRVAPLDWIGSRFDLPARRVPLDRSGHDFLRYKESRAIPTESDAASDDARRLAREAAIADGKVTPEEFDKAVDGTPKAWYKALVGEIDGALETLQRLDERAQEKFGDVAPGFGTLRNALEEIQRTARQLLKRKLEVEPDPVIVEDAGSGQRASGGDADDSPSDARHPAPGVSAEPTSRDDAAARIVGAARWLRQNDPYNPASYLMLRGFRWGELRAGGNAIQPRLLEAPTTQTRTLLKGMLLDQRWRELLEAGETVMGTPQGRGWLDLQRYILTACDELGSDYHFVATAIRSELRALLSELPQLVDMTLMDDTPTANAETRAWLRANVFPNGRAAAVAATTSLGAADDAGADVSVPIPVEDEREGLAASGARDVRALATAEVRSGRPDRAIALLMREAAREKTRRGRFLLQAQLASVMVEAGHEAVAMPILEELIAAIENHKLEEWEAGDVVAQPMALLYRCLGKMDGDPSTRQSLYLRICRLDPLQAMSFAQT